MPCGSGWKTGWRLRAPWGSAGQEDLRAADMGSFFPVPYPISNPQPTSGIFC